MHLPLTAADAASLGDGPAADGCKPDFVVGAELLGCERRPLVLDWNGQPAFTIPGGAQGWLVRASERIAFAEQQRRLCGIPGPGDGNARQTALARIELGQLSISLRCVTAVERVGLDDRLSPALCDQP